MVLRGLSIRLKPMMPVDRHSRTASSGDEVTVLCISDDVGGENPVPSFRLNRSGLADPCQQPRYRDEPRSHPRTGNRPDGTVLPHSFVKVKAMWEASPASPIDRARGFGIASSPFLWESVLRGQEPMSLWRVSNAVIPRGKRFNFRESPHLPYS